MEAVAKKRGKPKVDVGLDDLVQAVYDAEAGIVDVDIVQAKEVVSQTLRVLGRKPRAAVLRLIYG